MNSLNNMHNLFFDDDESSASPKLPACRLGLTGAEKPKMISASKKSSRPCAKA